MHQLSYGPTYPTTWLQTCNSYAQCLRHHLGWHSPCSNTRLTWWDTERKKNWPSLHRYVRKQNGRKFCEKMGFLKLSIIYRSQKAASTGKGFLNSGLTEVTESQRFQKWKLMENELTLNQVNWPRESWSKDKGFTVPFPNLWAISWPPISFF